VRGRFELADQGAPSGSAGPGRGRPHPRRARRSAVRRGPGYYVAKYKAAP